MNKKISRIRKEDLSYERMWTAIIRRVLNFGYRLSWKFNLGMAKTNQEQLLTFNNLHIGKRCFILGNGPSLAKMDLTKIDNEYTFGLNRIYLLFGEFSFRPTYYVAINELVIKQYSEEIRRLEMPKFLNWRYKKLFNPKDKSNTYINLKLSLRDNFQNNMTKPIYSGGTVTYAALQIAYWMGFQEVILIGVDHNFVSKGEPNKTEVRKNDVDQDHFHPDYFPKGSKWHLPDLRRSELAYAIARREFEGDGRKILDATIDGKLTVFPKVNYYDVV
jgi:hypothetical protein